jgi:hypothetical protein
VGEVVFQDESGEEHVVPIGPERPVISVGRSTECTIRSNRKSVSRHHAEFRFENGQVQIVDLDSSNGTWVMVDGERQPVDEPREVTHNDEIWCGDFILYYFGDDEGLVQESAPRVEPDFAAPQEQASDDKDHEALKDDYAELEQRCESLVEELESAEQRIEETAAANRALEEDIEALTEALDGAETLEEELNAARGRIAELEEELAQVSEQQPAAGAEADALNRLLDALDRTDLTELETVDRIRLQKVLREVRGRQTETNHG